MKVTVSQSRKNRKVVREYWHSYLEDGHIMAWLFTDVQGDMWMEYEPQGQSSKIYGNDRRVVHEFGSFHRAHGELPEHVTLKDFIAELDIDDYLTPSTSTYKIVNHYNIADDPRIFRSPVRALKEAKKREGEGWMVEEEETGKRIQLHPNGEGWVYDI